MQEYQDQENAIISFIQTFELSYDHLSSEDLIDGIIISKILDKIDSTIFDSSKLIPDCKQHWSLKHENLTIILNNLHIYNTKILQRNFSKDIIDISEITQNNNTQEFLQFLKLIISTIIASPTLGKEAVNNIEQFLQIQDQTSLMLILQSTDIFDDKLQSKMFLSNSSNLQLRNNLMEIDKLQNENDALVQRIQDLSQNNSSLNQRNIELKEEFKKSVEELQKNKLNKIIVMNEIGAENDEEFKEILMVKEQKIKNLQDCVTELNKKIENQQNIYKDEIDILQRKINSFKKLEKQLEFYKEKHQEYEIMKENQNIQEKEISNLRYEIEEIQRKKDISDQKYNHFKDKYNQELQKTLEQKLVLETLLNKLEQADQKQHLMQQKITDKEAKIQELSLYVDNTLNDSSNRSLKQDESYLYQDLSVIIQEKDKVISVLKMELNDYNNTNEKLDQEVLKEQINILNNKVQQLQAENNDLFLKAQKYEVKDFEALENEISRLKNENENYILINNKLLYNIKEKESSSDQSYTVNDLYQKIDIKQNQIKELQDKLKIQLSKNNVQENDQKDALIQLNQQKQLNENLKMEIKQLNQKYNCQELNQFQQSYEIILKENIELKKNNKAENDQDINQYQQQIQMTLKENQDLKQKIYRLNEKNNEEIRLILSVLNQLRVKYEEIKGRTEIQKIQNKKN